MSKKNFLRFVLLVGDIFFMYLALLLTLAFRYGDFSFWPGPQTRVFLFHFSFISAIWLLFLFLLDFYEIPSLKKVFNFFYNLIVFSILAVSTATIYFYLQPQPAISPKTILALDVLIFSLFLTGWRYLFSEILKVANFRQRIIMIGSLSDLSKNQIEKEGFEIIANFDLDSLDISKLKEKIEKADSIVFDSDFYKREDLMEKVFQNLPLELDYISFSDFYEEVVKKVPIGAIDKIWFLENISKPERKIDWVFKRSFDISFSLLGLLITGLVFPFIALAIKLDSKGPVFYSQVRVGKEGRHFTLYKFRTMRREAEKEGPRWAKSEDPRITGVGKVLRKTYLDEFPQFLNILRGDMSLVGPRPERPEFVEKLKKQISYYDIRHLVKPGFTGWAQINYRYGNSVKDAKEKLKYDLYYIKHRSLALDLSILLKTFRITVRDLFDLS